MDRFDEIMVTVFKWEGGFFNHPHDNGGPTNMGITHAVLAAWRGVDGVTVAEVRDLSREEATDIFRDRYWSKIKGDELPEPVDLVVMDGAVNHGVTNMLRMLQESVGVTASGRISAATIAAVAAATNSQAGVIDLAVKLAERRKQRYVNHEDAVHFLNGWRNRLNDVMAAALKTFPASWTFKDGRTNGAGGGSGTEPMPPSSIVRAVIEDEDLQAALATAGLYLGDIDGLFGPKSSTALDAYLTRRASLISGTWQSWPLVRRKLALGQLICRDLEIEVGRIDGLFGPRTEAAFVEFNRFKLGLPKDKWRDELDALPPPPTSIITGNTVWPTESEVPNFFGALGGECRSVPMKRLALPYTMKIAWDLSKTVTGFMIHTKAHDSAARVFEQFYRHYGDDGIRELGLDLFGGCFNCRRKSGGSSWSMHAWAIAIDFDPERNKLAWNHTRARLAKPDAVKFWEFWEAEGWLSLGRARDFDWMHIQAARL